MKGEAESGSPSGNGLQWNMTSSLKITSKVMLNGLHNYYNCTADELRMFWKVYSQGQNDVNIKLLFTPFVLHNITPIISVLIMVNMCSMLFIFSAVVGLCGFGVCRPHGGGLCH